MIRSAVAVFCVVCVATIATEALGLALLWQRGQLTAETLHDIRLVLSGGLSATASDERPGDRTVPTSDDVMTARIVRLFDLATREDELARIKAMLTERAEELSKQQQALAAQRQEFEAELQRLRDATQSEAADQARGVLVALPPADAVAGLMSLPLDENIRLLSGLPEKSIAKILKEFLQGGDEQAARGRQIFEALSRGQPMSAAIDRAAGPT